MRNISIQGDASFAQAPAKRRSFVQMFAHLHKVRLMWLEASVPEQLGGLQTSARRDPIDKRCFKKRWQHLHSELKACLHTAWLTVAKFQVLIPI